MANVGSWKPDRLDTIHYIHKLAEARVGEGYSVISGCDVHEKGTPDMDVVVDSGKIFYGDVYKTVAGNNVTISAANGTNDRIDVIYVDSSGVAQVHTGDALPVSDPLGNTIWTQYESPYPKTECPAGVIIALVYVPANDTSIENAQIEDIAQYGVSNPSAILDMLGSTEHHILVRGAAAWETALPARGASPYSRWQDDRWSMKAGDRDTLVSPTNGFEVWINGARYIKSTSSEYNLAAEATWDTISGTDYRIASNRAGVNFYIYACVPSSGNVPDIKISVNSTKPTGYTTSTSRKIGGFHCVPANMTSLPAGHDFISHVQGDIHCGDGRSGSIWDLLHRPKGIAAPEGMTWCEEANVWVMIYLISGTGVNTTSVNGGTISDNRNWMDFVDDCGAVGCRLPTDIEFQLFAAGSNEETNITGSADPGTTGHHLDTAGRSMISNCGCFDCCGVMWQWLSDQSFRVDGLTDPTVDPAWSWYDLPGAKGSLYRQGTYGDVKLRAGGGSSDGSYCGSRCRVAYDYRWLAFSCVGARAVVESA